MVKETKTESPVLFMSEASFSYAGGHSGAGVEGISLSLGKGEVALLCGPSGCGKTTVTRLANGLAPHFYEGTETGTVRVCGLDVAHAELWETARFVGSVFQNPKTQFYNVDVRGEVAFGCENLGFEPADIERRVDASAKEFNLTPLIDESLFSLSGGQKQRVACASAAATSPALVVLDEPSSNLDFKAIAQLRMAISRWKATGPPYSWQSIGSTTLKGSRITCFTSTTAASRADGRPASSRVSTMPSTYGSGCAREASTTPSETAVAVASQRCPMRKRRRSEKTWCASRT